MKKKNTNSILSDKFINKYMKMAKFIGEEGNSCYSRKIGTVIVDKNGIILSTGYNSPSRKTPNCDSALYIRDILWPKLNQSEKKQLASVAYGRECDINEAFDEEKIAYYLDGCKQCPRKLLNCKSGEKSDYCSCVHSETNSIINSSRSLKKSILFCWCKNLSCSTCTGNIINAGIKEVHFLEGEEYHKGCLKLYEYANISVFTYPENLFN